MRKTVFLISVSILVLLSCKDQSTSHYDYSTKDLNKQENILATIHSNNMKGLKWLNMPDEYSVSDNSVSITAGPKTDYFNDPSANSVNANAPFLYKEISGDFVATALLKPDFSEMWNAMSLMLYINNRNWIKFAFENSDATGKSIVTVVTRDVSDDANGVILNEVDMVWLKLARKNDNYSMHWSIDGIDYKMARLSAMPQSDTVKIGIEAQCPVGEKASHKVLFFSVKEETLENLRKIK